MVKVILKTAATSLYLKGQPKKSQSLNVPVVKESEKSAILYGSLLYEPGIHGQKQSFLTY